LNEIIDYKQQLSAIYMKHLDSSKLKLPSIPSNKNHTWQTFHVLLNDDFDRDKVIAKLKEKGIGTNYGAQCMPYMKVFQDKYHLDCRALFPNAMRAYEKGLALPIYEKLNAEDVLYISETLNQILD
jgi:dTDP-4-amino-4,6-dideoxygalactose transaminase